MTGYRIGGGRSRGWLVWQVTKDQGVVWFQCLALALGSQSLRSTDFPEEREGWRHQNGTPSWGSKLEKGQVHHLQGRGENPLQWEPYSGKECVSDIGQGQGAATGNKKGLDKEGKVQLTESVGDTSLWQDTILSLGDVIIWTLMVFHIFIDSIWFS